MNTNQVGVLQQQAVLATNKVLRNTYLLLGLSFIFSSLMAYLSFATGAHQMNILVFMVGVYGLMFLTSALKDSPLGLLAVFGFTGFLGYSLGPILNFYIANFANGPKIIATAMGGTGIIFFALSGYALTTRKNFNFLSGFLFIASMTAFLLGIGAIVLQMPAIYLLSSALFILVSSGIILFQTSEIIHGGETNYIMATVILFSQIYNLFLSLLNILSAFSNRD